MSEDKLTIEITQNSFDSNMMTVHARSEKYDYQTQKELWFMPRFRLPYVINSLQKDYEKVRKWLKPRTK